jgi:hypothetical protein
MSSVPTASSPDEANANDDHWDWIDEQADALLEDICGTYGAKRRDLSRDPPNAKALEKRAFDLLVYCSHWHAVPDGKLVDCIGVLLRQIRPKGRSYDAGGEGRPEWWAALRAAAEFDSLTSYGIIAAMRRATQVHKGPNGVDRHTAKNWLGDPEFEAHWRELRAIYESHMARRTEASERTKAKPRKRKRRQKGSLEPKLRAVIEVALNPAKKPD